MQLPDPIIQVFSEFQPLLSQPSYRQMMVLVCGTLLAHGGRTVIAALTILGWAHETNWSKYPNLRKRARFSGLEAPTIMLRLLLNTFVAPDAPVESGLDETLERRW